MWSCFCFCLCFVFVAHCLLSVNNWRGAWNKVLSESFCNVKISLIFSSKYKVIWKESMAIDQKSLKAFFHASSQLCCPSEWVSVTIESEPSTNSATFDPMFPDLWDFPRDRVFFRVFYRNAAYIVISSGPAWLNTIIILNNNRCSELHAVIDCLFFFKLEIQWLCFSK